MQSSNGWFDPDGTCRLNQGFQSELLIYQIVIQASSCGVGLTNQGHWEAEGPESGPDVPRIVRGGVLELGSRQRIPIFGRRNSTYERPNQQPQA
jgi:hypothetical protein